jgi:hypothetical protein
VLDPEDPDDTESHVAIGSKLYDGMHLMEPECTLFTVCILHTYREARNLIENVSHVLSSVRR